MILGSLPESSGRTSPGNQLQPYILMKIILFTTSLESRPLLLHEIEKADHALVDFVHDPDQLIQEIARATPHLLVAHVPEQSDAAHLLAEQVRLFFPDLAICFLNGTLDPKGAGQQPLGNALARPIQHQVPRPYAEGDRIVFHARSFQDLCSGKLNRPQQNEGWEKICSHQEARFVVQLQTARKNHSAAKHYFECLSRQQQGLDQEIGYRLAHGSYKALSWSRDLAVRWLALLAHYVSDAELEYLPGAGTPGLAIDFVHHDLPI
jgi:hypothetical protein